MRLILALFLIITFYGSVPGQEHKKDTVNDGTTKPKGEKQLPEKQPSAAIPVLGKQLKTGDFVRLSAMQELKLSRQVEEELFAFRVTTYYKSGARLVPRANEEIVIKMSKSGLKIGKTPKLKHWYFRATDKEVMFNGKVRRVLEHPTSKEITEDSKYIAIIDSSGHTRFVEPISFENDIAKIKDLSESEIVSVNKKQLNSKTISALKKWAKNQNKK